MIYVIAIIGILILPWLIGLMGCYTAWCWDRILDLGDARRYKREMRKKKTHQEIL